MELLFSGSGIHKSYPRSRFTLVVNQLSLYSGTITGVVGENGNGKTTLLNIVAGELEAEGSLNYHSLEKGNHRNWSKLKDHIAFIPQRIPRWYGTLYQNLVLKASLEGIEGPGIDNYLNDILEFLHLNDYKHLTWSEISTGFRLRFELARTLIGRPQLIVLDEPIANLDINTQQKFLSDLKKILSDRNYPVAVILSSQQLHEIESVADHMVFLRNGNAVFSGNVESISDEQQNDLIELQVKNDEGFEQYLIKEGISFTKKGEYFNLELAKDGSKKTLLTNIMQEGFDISYFRDISNSTKRLFSE